MPGMGIVACVLGVVLAMGKITEPPDVLGHYIGAALVGTFSVFCAAYGLFGPMGAKLENFCFGRTFLFQRHQGSCGGSSYPRFHAPYSR